MGPKHEVLPISALMLQKIQPTLCKTKISSSFWLPFFFPFNFFFFFFHPRRRLLHFNCLYLLTLWCLMMHHCDILGESCMYQSSSTAWRVSVSGNSGEPSKDTSATETCLLKGLNLTFKKPQSAFSYTVAKHLSNGKWRGDSKSRGREGFMGLSITNLLSSHLNWYILIHLKIIFLKTSISRSQIKPKDTESNKRLPLVYLCSARAFAGRQINHSLFKQLLSISALKTEVLSLLRQLYLCNINF